MGIRDIATGNDNCNKGLDCDSGTCQKGSVYPTGKCFYNPIIDHCNYANRIYEIYGIPPNAIKNATSSKCQAESICTNKAEDTTNKQCNDPTDCISGKCTNGYCVGCGTNNGNPNQGCPSGCGCKIDGSECKLNAQNGWDPAGD